MSDLLLILNNTPDIDITSELAFSIEQIKIHKDLRLDAFNKVNYCWSEDQQLPSNEGMIPVSNDTCLDISRDISPTAVSPQA